MFRKLEGITLLRRARMGMGMGVVVGVIQQILTNNDSNFNKKQKDQQIKKIQSRYLNICTIFTSESELIESTYMVTPTSTGGPESISQLTQSISGLQVI